MSMQCADALVEKRPTLENAKLQMHVQRCLTFFSYYQKWMSEEIISHSRHQKTMFPFIFKQNVPVLSHLISSLRNGECCGPMTLYSCIHGIIPLLSLNFCTIQMKPHIVHYITLSHCYCSTFSSLHS